MHKHPYKMILLLLNLPNGDKNRHIRATHACCNILCWTERAPPLSSSSSVHQAHLLSGLSRFHSCIAPHLCREAAHSCTLLSGGVHAPCLLQREWRKGKMGWEKKRKHVLLYGWHDWLCNSFCMCAILTLNDIIYCYHLVHVCVCDVQIKYIAKKCVISYTYSCMHVILIIDKNHIPAGISIMQQEIINMNDSHVNETPLQQQQQCLPVMQFRNDRGLWISLLFIPTIAFIMLIITMLLLSTIYLCTRMHRHDDDDTWLYKRLCYGRGTARRASQ